MFLLPGIILVIVVDYIKPQEIFPLLRQLPLLYIAMALAILGFVVDLRLGITRLKATPHLFWVALFYIWAIITVAVKAPDTLNDAIMLMIPISLYLVIGHGVQTFRSFHVIVGVILALGIFLAAVGVHQAMGPWRCHRLAAWSGQVVLMHDGRDCDPTAERDMCSGEGAEPGYEYKCERRGILETSTIQGRVKFRGTLADPNELALAVGIALPFAFVLFERRRGLSTGIFLLIATTLVGLCAIFTQSRGGQLILMSVLGIYFVRKVGLVKGALIGLVMASPLLLLGGRGGDESDASTESRIHALGEHFNIWRASPIFGAGYDHATDHYWHTAHNAYMLAASDTGLPGIFLFTLIYYISLKIPWRAMRLADAGKLAPIAGAWGTGLFASLIGMAVGILFLSFNYKEILWIYFGLTAAFYLCVQHHEPGFKITVSKLELLYVFIWDILFLIASALYAKMKGVI